MLKVIRLPHLLYIAFISFALPSCNTFDPPTVVPAYGHIDSIHFYTSYYASPTSPAQGTASAKIPYTWVYLDDNPVGSFQMPCTFPMVAGNGMHNIKIYPAIAAADGNSTLNINPFYQYYSISVNLQQGVITKFQPASTYYSWVKFVLMEDFNTGNEIAGGKPLHISNYIASGSGGAGASDTTMLITHTPGDVFQGAGSGMAIVSNLPKKSYYIGMTDTFSLLSPSTPAYVELNYKTSALLSVGMISQDTVNLIYPSVVVYPTSSWTKLYVSLNKTISTFQTKPYRIYFTISLASGHTADTLLLDNIKILN